MDDYRGALPRDHELRGYRVQRILGLGAFGITYLADDLRSGRPVAIKEYMPSQLAVRGRDGVSVMPLHSRARQPFEFGMLRFREEAQTLVTFEHPNIVAVERFFEANGTAYMVMVYHLGESLADAIERRGPIEQAELLEILFPLLDGLRVIHRHRFLHRDVKPENIYLVDDGRPVLLDFGAARIALIQESKGLTAIVSPGYAPLEQYARKTAQGPWTDIYGMAATVYAMMTVTRPPDATERYSNDKMVPARTAGRGRYDPALLAAIDWGLTVAPDDRPRSVRRWIKQFAHLAPLADARGR